MPLPLLRPTVFDDFPNVVAAFSMRGGGTSEPPFDSLNTGLNTGDDKAAVRENRRRLVDALGFAPGALATVGQVHGADVMTVAAPGFTPEHDGLVTKQRGLLLGITVADCAAVLLADPKARVIGACHAGWRGTVSGIPIMTVEAMRKQKADPSRIRAYVSPCIGPEDFEVGPEVARQFDDDHVLAIETNPKPHVDLAGAIVTQLLRTGIPETQIEVATASTFDTERFFSYRTEGGTTGRMMGLIGLREDG